MSANNETLLKLESPNPLRRRLQHKKKNAIILNFVMSKHPGTCTRRGFMGKDQMGPESILSLVLEGNEHVQTV